MEVWKDISGYEGLYQASNLGRIKALEKWREFGAWTKKNTRIYPEKIMKLSITRGGYNIVQFCKDGACKWFAVHIIIASTFIANPENKKEVNHKDGIKTNNPESNLEWSTRRENIDHAIKNGLMNSPTGSRNSKSKKVLNQETGHIYASINEAAIQSGISIRSLRHQLDGSQKNKTILKLL